MIKRVILMCAGRAERWGKHRGVAKHFVPVGGEMLLDRTLRLVREHTEAEIVIVAFDPAYNRDGHERFEPRHGPQAFCDTDKFLSSEERWAERGQTVLLYGDVYFTKAAMKTILSYHGTHRFFGRQDRSHFTGCRWGELFALSFPANERDRLRENMFLVRSKLHAGELKRGGGWEVYKHIHGTSWDNFIVIDDFTDDFDFPRDYERWLRRYRNPVHRLLVPVYSPAIKRLSRWSRAITRLFGKETVAQSELGG